MISLHECLTLSHHPFERKVTVTRIELRSALIVIQTDEQAKVWSSHCSLDRCGRISQQ